MPLTQHSISAHQTILLPLEGHGIRNLLYLWIFNDVHVLPALHQAGGGQPRSVRLPVHLWQRHVAHVVHVPVGSEAAVQEHVRREKTDDLDHVFGYLGVLDHGLLHSHADGSEDRSLGVV